MAIRRYIIVSALVTVMFVTLTGIFNYVIDPYGIYRDFRFEGINSEKPRASTQIRMAKAYGIKLIKPKSIALGNSRVDIGLDPLYCAWPEDGQPVYNLGIPGSTIYASLRCLQHALSVQEISCVVMGLDFMDFPISPDTIYETKPEEFEQWLDINNSEWQTSFHYRRFFKAGITTLFSLTALTDSVRTIIDQHSENMTVNGFNPLEEYNAHVRKEGHYAIFLHRDMENIKKYKEKPNNLFLSGTHSSPHFDCLREIIRICKTNKIRLYLYIHPFHVRLNETIRISGLWPLFEQWKRELAKTVREESASDSPVPLWDFSGYNSVTAEPVPKAGDTETKMKWYWEAGHYKKETGNMILDRIFGHQKNDDEIYSDFGQIIDTENIEQHMETINRNRMKFITDYPEVVSDISKLSEKFK